jgi:hypothetical protein
MHPIRAIQTFACGLSFWHVELSTNRTWSQLDTVFDPIRGKPEKKYMRPLEWYEDLVATGDVKKIKMIVLHTPKGDAAIDIREPGTAYQFNAASLLLDISGGPSGRQRDAQIIGRVDDKATGLGVAFIWDVPMQQVYKDESADIRNFQGWRPGIQPLGLLAIENMGLSL